MSEGSTESELLGQTSNLCLWSRIIEIFLLHRPVSTQTFHMENQVKHIISSLLGDFPGEMNG